MKIILFRILLIVFVLQFPVLSDEPVKAEHNKFIIIGDTQHIGFWESLYWEYWGEQNQEKTKQLFNEISKRDPDFILHLGDITRDGSSLKAWNEFDNDSRSVKEKGIKYYPVFGNHEYYGSSDEMYNNFYKRFSHIKDKKWYSFVYNQVGFLLINTNFDDLSKNDTTEQRKWYLQKLNEMEADDSIKKIITAGHYPPFTNSTIVSSNSIVRKDYAAPFINSKKGIFFFSGHCHSYERFSMNGKIFIVSGGGGGPRQKLNIDKTDREFEDKYDGPAKRFFHFCEIELSQDSLYFRVIKLNEDGSFSEAEKIVVSK